MGCLMSEKGSKVGGMEGLLGQISISSCLRVYVYIISLRIHTDAGAEARCSDVFQG